MCVYYSIKNSGVYTITNSVNKRLYVGSTCNLNVRFNEHKRQLRGGVHHSKSLQNFANKYGFETLSFNIIEYCERENLIRREQYWIDFYQCYKSTKGFNNSPIAGSPLGVKHTAAQNREKSVRQKGQKRGQETIDRISKALTGKKHSEASRQKMSAIQKTRKRKPHSEETKRRIGDANRGKPSWILGKKLSEEIRKQMSERFKGLKKKSQSKETIEKRVQSLRGKPLSEERRKKLSEAGKKWWSENTRKGPKRNENLEKRSGFDSTV